MNAYYRIVILTVICFVSGYMLWDTFYELSINEIKTSRIALSTTSSHSSNSGITLFAFAIGSIPLLYTLVVKFSNITSTKQKVISLAIILICGIMTWQAKLMIVLFGNWRMNSVLESTSQDIQFEYPVYELQPQLFLATGLIIGTIGSTLIFKSVNVKTEK